MVHDSDTGSVAVGAGLLLAGRRTAWRAPAMIVATVWNNSHAVSHLADIGQAEPGAAEITEAALPIADTLLLGTLVIASKEDA